MSISPVFRMPGLLTALAVLSGCAAHPPADGKSLFRTDRIPADAPYTNADLVQNFGRLAFGLEAENRRLPPNSDYLRRWQDPIRWRLHTAGDTDATAQADVAATAVRIANATAHDIRPAATGAAANLDVWLLGPQDYDTALDWAARGAPSRGKAAMIRDFRVGGLPCAAQFSYLVRSGKGLSKGAITYALVLVRKGLERTYRLSCFEEEMAQIVGLTNEDMRVRPSIFNDDEEFVLLTRHDETLLNLLYNPALHPGMAPDEALPIVARLLEEEL